MATSKLDILISAKNNASSAIKSVEGDLKGLDKAAGSIAGGLGSLAGAAGVAGIAALGAAAVSTAVDLAKTAAETERLGTAFDNLAGQAGQSGDAMLAAMQEAAHGTISNAELMASANRAMLLGVADSADEMSKLLEVAGARGKAMGESTAQAFSDIVTGIGRGSALILDNLGIVVDAAAANEAYAESIGKSASQLTEAEKKQALFNAVIADSTQIIKDNQAAGDDAASNFERMDAAISNAKDALGQLFSPAIAAIAQSIADAAKNATDGMKEMAKTDLGAVAQQAYAAQASLAGLEQTLASQTALLDDMRASGEESSLAYQNLAQAAVDTRASIDDAKASMAAYGVAASKTSGSLYDMWIAEQNANIAAQEAAIAARAAASALGDEAVKAGMLTDKLAELKAQSDATAAALDGISNAAVGAIHSAASAAVGIMPTGEIVKIYDETSKKVAEQTKIMHELGMSTSEIDFRTQEYAKNASAPFDIAVEAAREADKALNRHAKNVDQLSKEYTALEGAVSGVLSGALDPGVGVDPSDLLPRQDAINEDARRLADVAVNGWASPWAEYFKNEFPEQFQEMAASNDIKTGAAIMLRNFQDGLEPELINKELAKERVRKMLIGDQNMAALATEIATELAAEMGIPMQEALAAAQGTLGGGTGMGTEAATSFADGASAALDEGNGGGSFVTKFSDQMRASYGLLSQAGKDAGKLWGANFLEVVGENVPPALIKILTDLVTPGVLSALAQQGSLTRAVP